MHFNELIHYSWNVKQQYLIAKKTLKARVFIFIISLILFNVGFRSNGVANTYIAANSALATKTALANDAHSAPKSEHSNSVSGTEAGLTSIQVQLFNQPCALKGPFNERTLLGAHHLGPAMISIRATSPTTARDAIQKIQKAVDFPSSLTLYRDHAIRYLELQEKLLIALEDYFKSNDLSKLQTEVAKHVSKRLSRMFKRKSKSLHQQVFASTEERKESWIFLIRELGGRDPQETFHSVTQTLKIQYHCQFDAQE